MLGFPWSRCAWMDEPPSAKKHTGKKPQKTAQISKELAAILRVTSKIDPRADLQTHLTAIETRRAQETECFLRACVLRMQKT